MNHVFKTIHKKMKGFANTTVVVSENASSLSCATDNRSALSQDIQITDIFTTIKQTLSVSMASLLFVSSLQADIIADASAPHNQQPTILLTNSGATQVNIQTPTAGGVSMNQYTQFDTKNNGTIINNSRTNTNTATAGWVQANPWLATGSASVIVNQVNSSNPSNLTGNIEIAGSKADFIIANPNGISIDGATIINAGGTTLTTGTPLLNNGNLDGFSINNGTVSIQGSGLNALGSDYTSILARAAVINAGIWANDLKVVTGTNTISADSTNIEANTPNTPAPLFAIDSSVLGGMYANKITFIGTESGVGINNAGTINAGTISIDTNGMLTNRGLIDGSQTTVKADTINNIGTGRIYGDFLALQAVTLNNTDETIGGINASAIVAARENLQIGVQTLNNIEHSSLYSGGDMYIGGYLDENNLVAGKASEINNISATIESKGNMSLASDKINNINNHLEIQQVIDSIIYEAYILPDARYEVGKSGEWFSLGECSGIFGKQDDNYCGTEALAILKQIEDIKASYSKNSTTNPFYINSSPLGYIVDKEYQRLMKLLTPYTFEDYTVIKQYTTTSHTELVSSDPAEIISGGDMYIDGLLYNKDSHVIAGGTILTSQNPINEETKGQDIISFDGSTIERTTVESSGLFGNSHKRKWHGKASYDLADIYSELYTLGSNQNLEDPQDQINGAIISASSIITTGSNDLFNNGTIIAYNAISLNSAGLINNDTGNIKADGIALRANDININRGNVEANSVMILDAANNINIASQTYSTSNTDGKSSFSRTGMQNNANIAVNNSDGLLLVNAGNDINLNSADIINNGIFTQFQAGNDINLGTIQTSQQDNVIWNSKNHRIEGYSHEVGNTIQTNGDNTIIAGNDINVIAGTIDSFYGTTALMAINNINILSGTDTTNYDEATYIKTSSLLGTTKTTTLETKDTTTSQGSYIGGDRVLIASGNDLKIQGGAVISDNGTALSAKNDINILSPTDTVYQTYFNQVKKSGLFSNGGLSVTLGSSMNSIDSDNSYTMLNGSMVGSLYGDTMITAGNDLIITASDVIAGNDIFGVAKNITVIKGENEYDSSVEQKFKSSGLTVSLGGTIGNAANAIDSTLSQASSANDRGNDRLTAAYATKAALIATQAGQSIYQDITDVSDASKAAQGSIIGVSVSVGSSKSKSIFTSNSTETASSTVTAGNRATFIAIGDDIVDSDGYANSGNLLIYGSNVSGKYVDLIAAKDMYLLSAASTSAENSNNESSGFAVGANVGISASGNVGVSVFVNANMAEGQSVGENVTYVESTVNATDNLNILSGRDTDIIGAIASGNSVYANIGRDLNIRSLQDSATYDSKQTSASAGIEVPIVGAGALSGSVSANQQKILSNYVSVNEQSGIIAGNGGFDITVKSNTDLNGGTIVSAAPKELNSLNTGSLTFNNLENYAEYKVSSSGIGFSTGGSYSNLVKRTIASQAPQALNNSEKVSSTTYAALSSSNVTINGKTATDEQLQGLATVKSDSHINTIFNLQDVQDSMALASTIGDIGVLSNNVISTALSRDSYVARDKAIANAEANYKDSVSEAAWNDYVKNPDVGILLKFEFDQKYATDPYFRVAYDSLSDEKKVTFIQDSINQGNYFGSVSQAEAQWHQTQTMYGIGSDLDRATQAITGALSALAMGNSSGAVANLTQPYIANEIGNYFDDPKNTNETARLFAHAALGAASAYISGNDAASGALGAASGEAIAILVQKELYGDKSSNELTQQEKETIRAVATLASGLVGAMSGGSFEDSATAAAAGYNAAVNNKLKTEAEAEASNLRNQGFYFLAKQDNPDDPNSWYAYPALSAAYQIAVGQESAPQYWNGSARETFDKVIKIISYAFLGSKIMIGVAEEVGYGWSVQKAAGLTGGTYGAGLGMIDNASGINFQDWISPSHYINQFFESHDSATK
ncbi:MAG: hemagglutinin repeat-containing protein [Sulfurovaceae bacterium]|nr:hemagglutinin repeat-containing protein [Sulfurovaceae bacterium]